MKRVLIISGCACLIVFASAWVKQTLQKPTPDSIERRRLRVSVIKANTKEQVGASNRLSWGSERLDTLLRAAELYVQDHKGFLPKCQNWEESLKPYVDKINRTVRDRKPEKLEALVKCPTLPTPRRFAMNRALSGVRAGNLVLEGKKTIYKVDSRLILFFESTHTQANACGDISSVPEIVDGATIIGHCFGTLLYAPPNAQVEIGGVMSAEALSRAIEDSRKLENILLNRLNNHRETAGP